MSEKSVYRIPLKYLVDIGLVNLPTEFNIKMTFNLENGLGKLFETKAKLANVGGKAAPLSGTLPYASVYFYAIPYEQIKLSDTFQKYITKIINSKRVLRTGIKPTPPFKNRTK